MKSLEQRCWKDVHRSKRKTKSWPSHKSKLLQKKSLRQTENFKRPWQFYRENGIIKKRIKLNLYICLYIWQDSYFFCSAIKYFWLFKILIFEFCFEFGLKSLFSVIISFYLLSSRIVSFSLYDQSNTLFEAFVSHSFWNMIINLKDSDQERDCYISDSAFYICCYLWGFYEKLIMLDLCYNIFNA